MTEEDEARVAAGYDVVYEGLPRSATFDRVWRAHSLGDDFPSGFEHISFVTLPEMRMMAAELRIGPGGTLVDLGCGMGGPGLWIARETGARLVGIDVSNVALARAGERAARIGLSSIAEFRAGTFAATGLADGSADAAMSCDAFQYAPDKQAALDEAARILRPGGMFVFVCFEFEPERVAGLPVFGADPVSDYAPLLRAAGFDVVRYEETAGWRERVTATYGAVIDAKEAIAREMGEGASRALVGEMSLTLQLRPYRRRVMVAAIRR